jgi:hypothetical protein
LNALTFVHLEQREVWRWISDVKTSSASMEPCRFKWKKQKGDGTGHFGHHPPEGLWRLMHGPPDKNPERAVDNGQTEKNPEQEHADK